MTDYQFPEVHTLVRSEFALATTPTGATWFESKPIETQNQWTEANPSWNVNPVEGNLFKIELRVQLVSGKWSTWYKLGDWTTGPNNPQRTSLKDQKDSFGSVDTDTLTLTEPAQAYQVRYESKVPDAVKRVFVCTSDPSQAIIEVPSDPSVWGTILPVPKRFQNDYPNGGVICSATSTSMILKYWAKVKDRSDIDVHVANAATQIYDEAWKGTGNWPFNMAFAGSFPGMVAYVARFSSVADLEKWIQAGIPVATSVSYNLLRGRERGSDDGHLVVLVGFDKSGNPIFNDPAVKPELQTTYPRADFEKGWSDSGRTVYLVFPEGTVVPKPVHGEWLPTIL